MLRYKYGVGGRQKLSLFPPSFREKSLCLRIVLKMKVFLYDFKSKPCNKTYMTCTLFQFKYFWHCCYLVKNSLQFIKKTKAILYKENIFHLKLIGSTIKML